MDTLEKIELLSAAAKYDASCSSSGSDRRNSGRQGGGQNLGNTVAGGICHTWAADGRCISLLKVLLSSACAWDCAYCVNRRSNDHKRASFEVEELVGLVMDFYRRNYIEGAFLSSAVLSCPDATMERLVAVAKILRTREHFNGYLHLKAIPGASDALVVEAGRWADRVSVNIELPSSESLSLVAPDKSPAAIFGSMRALARASGFEPRKIASRNAVPQLSESGALAAEPVPMEGGSLSAPAKASAPGSVYEARKGRHRDPSQALLPAGQTTQMVVGASPESDATILTLAENLYLGYDVRRVYYSAYIPVSTDTRVPALAGPPLLREHRLYQADWLFRFYGFTASEIVDDSHPFLDDRLDPKAGWALRHMEFFPVDVNRASYTELLRVPGIGPKSASRILRARRSSPLKEGSLKGLGVVMKRAKWFLTCSGKLLEAPGGRRWERSVENPEALRGLLTDGAESLLKPLQSEFDWSAAV